MSDPQPSPRIRLRRLEVRNYQAIKIAVFEIQPGVNELFGRPAQGKSTIPQSVRELLTRGGVSSKPLRTGAADGSIRGDFSDGTVVEKQIGPKGAKPSRVILPDGTRAGLDALQGWVSEDIFDPLAFGALAATKPGRRTQAEIIAELTGLDTSAIDDERSREVAGESAAARAAEELEAQARWVVVPPPVEAPGELRDEAAIASKKGEAAAAKASNDLVRRRCDEFRERAKQRLNAMRVKRDQIAAIHAELEALEAEDTKERAEAASYETRAAALVDPDTTAIDREIAEAKAHNARVRAATEQQAAHTRATIERAKLSDRATAKRTEERDRASRKRDCDARKAAAIAVAAARMPIPGLTIEGAGADRELYLNGEPASQASTKERMALGCAIAMARKVKLGLLWIDYGNELDAAAIEWLQGFLEANDADAIVVHVVYDAAATDKADGLVIEAGEITADRRKPRRAKAAATSTAMPTTDDDSPPDLE